MNNFVSEKQRKKVMGDLNHNKNVKNNSIEIDIKVPNDLPQNKMVESRLDKYPPELREHYDTGLKLTNGWKIGEHMSGGEINSKSQIEVRKKDKMIHMSQLDGRLGGGYNVEFRSDKGRVYMFYKKYDEVLDTFHSLMRMI